MKNSTLLHLRIPFSFFLMPIFFFAFSIVENPDIEHAVLAFVALHLFIYPASNGFNSFYDQDEGSIGGLRNPPPVSSELLFMSLLFDISGIVVGFFVGLEFTIVLFIYGLVSKAYSHPKIRLKKYPILGLLSVSIFQGAFVVWSVYQIVARQTISQLMTDEKAIFAGILAVILLTGSYPMTQIYQHQEDAKRGDKTISRLLGIRGTFVFTAVVFGIANVGFVWFFYQFYDLRDAVLFQIALLPVLVFFSKWAWRVFHHKQRADFRNTMRLNFLSALCLNGFFLFFWLDKNGFLNN